MFIACISSPRVLFGANLGALQMRYLMAPYSTPANWQAVCKAAFGNVFDDIDATRATTRGVFVECATWMQTLARTFAPC
jgi:hypothetical protein